MAAAAIPKRAIIGGAGTSVPLVVPLVVPELVEVLVEELPDVDELVDELVLLLVLLLVDELPSNAMGKVQKPAIKKLFAE